MGEGDDPDRAWILSRRARWIAIAMAAASCSEPDKPSKPTVCLSFECPKGSVYVGGNRSKGGGGLITARPGPGDCVPADSLPGPPSASANASASSNASAVGPSEPAPSALPSAER